MKNLTLEQILKIGEELGEVKAEIYMRHDEEAIEYLQTWLQYDATTHNVKEFGKWIQEQKEKQKTPKTPQEN